MSKASASAAAKGLPAFPRRGFLRGLAALPLIGGGVTIIGHPTRADVPLTDELWRTYSTWLAFERHFLHVEMDPDNVARLDHFVDMQNPASTYHWVDFGETDRKREQPSTRAAAVLAAVGCDWTWGDRS